MSWVEQELREQPAALARLLEAETDNVLALAGNLVGADVHYLLIASRGSSGNAARYAQYLLGRAHRVPVAFATPSLYTLYEQPPRLSDDGVDVGGGAALRDAHDQRAVEPRRLLVERVERRSRERDRDAMGSSEQVLRVARRVRRAATRGDQDVLDVRAPEELRDVGRGRCLPLDQACERLGLLRQLDLEPRTHASSSATAS